MPVRRGGQQCRMLHLLIGLTAGVALAAPEGLERRPAVVGRWAPLTPDSRAALARKIAQKTVVVRRSRPNPLLKFVEPRIAGWWAGPGRVVTSTWVVAGWPSAEDDRIEVQKPDGTWQVAAVGLDDAHIGYAVLDVPGLPAPPEAPAALAPADEALMPNGLLYAAFGPTLTIAPVGLRGTGQKAYYFKLGGAPLPVGTPLFDPSGAFVSLVALPSGVPHLAGFVLPVQATQALFDRGVEWR